MPTIWTWFALVFLPLGILLLSILLYFSFREEGE